MFEFQSEISEKKFKGSKDVDPVLLTVGQNPDFYVIVDHPLPSTIISSLSNFIKNTEKGVSFEIISALPFKPKEKDLKKSIFELYAMNGTKLTKYIPPGSKIITLGRGLYDVTYGDDLTIEGFYDTIQWHTSFFDPKTLCHIYPCPGQFIWLGKDNFESFFVKNQLHLARTTIFPSKRIRKPILNFLDTKEKCTNLLKSRLDYSGALAWDTETKNLDPWNPTSKLLCLTLCFEDDPYTGYFLPWNLIDITLLNSFFDSKKLVGNNSKYDVRWLVINGKVERKSLMVFWDNMKGSQVINELQRNSLKSDAWLYTPYGGYDFELDSYKMKYKACKSDYSLIPTNILFPYATMDAIVSMLCYLAQQEIIDSMDKLMPTGNSWSIRKSLEQVSFPAINTFADIELDGMSYDWDKLSILSKELRSEIDTRRKDLYKLLDMPESINIDSGDQLGSFLEKKGWENPGRGLKGIYNTNEAAMLYWKKKGHPEVEAISEYTEYSTAMKTFVGEECNSKGKPTGYYQYRSTDDKIHGTFMVMMADSGRNKSKNPNLQNIIKSSSVYLGSKPFSKEELEKLRSEDKKIVINREGKVLHISTSELLDSDEDPIPLHVRVRECFGVPSPDYVLSENDGKGLQLHIAATYSQDPVMKDIFINRGGDMHSMTARSVFCPEVDLDYFIAHKNEKPYKTYRKKAKAVNFGLLFNETSRAFASSSLLKGWTLQEAKDYVKNYHLEELQEKYNNLLLKNMGFDITDVATWKQDQLEFSYYWASADDIKTKFFDTYKGLHDWQESMYSFARHHGYTQSLWGPIRRTPYLTYHGKDDDKGRIKNYENIAVNSPIQNFEAEYVMYNMSRTNTDFKKNKMKTYFIGNIHDSALDYMFRPEFQKVKDIFIKYFHEPLDIMMGIPYEMDFGYSDLAKGEVWGITEHEF